MLSKAVIEAAEPKPSRYLLADRDGLYLRVSPNGLKRWIVRYWVHSKEHQKTLGEYPSMSLTEARKACSRFKMERANPKSMTLGELAKLWLSEYSSKLEQSSAYNHRLFVSYFKELHALPAAEIGRKELVAVIRKVQQERSYMTARRVAMTLGQIYEFGMNSGLVATSPAVRLSTALTASKEDKQERHFATILSADGISVLLNALDYVDNMTVRLALKFVAYTFVRSGELRMAQWSEVDLARAVWSIPKAHTKRSKPHAVPLSRQALDILRTQQERLKHKDGYIFPSDKTGGMMSKFTLLLALKMLRTLPDDIRPAEMTVHGFRAMASTILNESGLWTPDAIERQLSHSPENDVRAAYNRGEYWEERVRMMQWYADYLDTSQKRKNCSFGRY